jgi:hypothetical protein
MSNGESNDTTGYNQSIEMQNIEEYPSSELLLSIVQKEYDLESDRKRDLESRAGILIALLGTMVGFYIKDINLSFIKGHSTEVELLFYILIIALYLVPVTSLMAALFHLVNVIMTRDYQRIGLGFDYNLGMAQKDEVAQHLTWAYKDAVEKNMEVNDQKVIHFKKGIKFAFLSIISIIVIYILVYSIKLLK